MRVRLVDKPPTDYQRWELEASHLNTDAGEEIRHATRSAAIAAGLPVEVDWWLFDESAVALMRFDEGGVPPSAGTS